MERINGSILLIFCLVWLGGCTSKTPIEAQSSQENEVPSLAKMNECITLHDGILEYHSIKYLEGQVVRVGFNEFGYNYQAHVFKGSYANVFLGADGLPPYLGEDASYLAENPSAADKWYWPLRGTYLHIKWNDAYISNKDCDNNGRLDRHFGFNTYAGSGAWRTIYVIEGSGSGKFSSFVKTVAVPIDAEFVDGVYYASDGTEIGPREDNRIGMAVVQKVGAGSGGGYVSPAGPGLGQF